MPTRRYKRETRGDAVVKDISGDGEELLKFPVAYPIKVVGRRSESLRANIDAIVRAARAGPR